MLVKITKKLTLREFLTKKGIKLTEIKSIGYTTLRNIIRGRHDWDKYNNNYKGRLPYFPTDKTVKNLSNELEITIWELKTLIENQHKGKKN